MDAQVLQLVVGHRPVQVLLGARWRLRLRRHLLDERLDGLADGLAQLVSCLLRHRLTSTTAKCPVATLSLK